MLRSFIPFLLASLGFTMILWSDRMPVFEWQLSDIAVDFSSPCDFKLPPPLWKTRLGETLDLKGKPYPLENLNVVVRRSRDDEVLDRVSFALYNNTSWLSVWSLIEVILSVLYMWWFLLQDKQLGVSYAFLFTTIAAGICMCALEFHVVSFAGPAIGWQRYYFAEDCRGTITFGAKLIKIYYETPAIFFTGILMELGALGMMFRQTVKTVEASAKSAVG